MITFGADPSDFAGAYKSAKQATEATRDVIALAGRAAYVERGKIEGIPDAGAWGLGMMLDGVKEGLGL